MRRGAITGALTLALTSLLFVGTGIADEAEQLSFMERFSPPSLARVSRRAKSDPLKGLDPRKHALEGDALVSNLGGGRKAQLTLNPKLQAHIESVLARYEVPYGALVALDPHTGRVLAYVSHSSESKSAGDLCRDASPPAASVFKVVTAAALIDAGVDPEERVCYRGGSSRIVMSHLDEEVQSGSCATLPEALGSSINAVFAKLADRHLDRKTLHRYAEAFGFGHSLPFDVPTDASREDVPTNRLERARTAAGFWHMHLSPLHGALLAATIANDGVMPRAAIVESVEDASGRSLYRHEASMFREVIPRYTARRVASMMERTVSHGTARRAFRDPAGRPFLPGIRVAGKTGSLSSERPYRAYSWWVGHAPADKPTIALAALVINGPKWRIKASYLAKEGLREHLFPAKP